AGQIGHLHLGRRLRRGGPVDQQQGDGHGGQYSQDGQDPYQCFGPLRLLFASSFLRLLGGEGFGGRRGGPEDLRGRGGTGQGGGAQHASGRDGADVGAERS